MDRVQVPFKQSNLRYLEKYDTDLETLKILNNKKEYFFIIERALICESQHKDFIKSLSFIQNHAYMLFNNCYCYLCYSEDSKCPKFDTLTTLYLHYLSAHSEYDLKLNFWSDKNIKKVQIFFLLTTKENSKKLEDNSSFYISNKQFYHHFDQKEREIALDGIICQKTFKYKTLKHVIEDVERTASIVEKATNARNEYNKEEDKDAKGSAAKQQVSHARKSAADQESKRQVEYDRASLAPFHYDYFDPISGEVTSLMMDDTTKPSVTSHMKRKNPLTQHKEDENRKLIKDVPKMDLFLSRSQAEIKRRLGDDCFLHKDIPQYYDAVFMQTWNKIKSLGDTMLGGQIKLMIDIWALRYDESIKEMHRKKIKYLLEIIREIGQIDVNDMIHFLVYYEKVIEKRKLKEKAILLEQEQESQARSNPIEVPDDSADHRMECDDEPEEVIKLA